MVLIKIIVYICEEIYRLSIHIEELTKSIEMLKIKIAKNERLFI